MVRSAKRWAAIAALTAVATAAAWAAAVDGKWTWMQRGQGGNEVAVVLELKADDKGVLTGSLTRGDMKSDIKDGKVTGAVVEFAVDREVNGNKITIKYNGKLDGDKITGTTAFVRDGQAGQGREWIATRAK